MSSSSSANDKATTNNLPFGVRVDATTGRYMSEDGSWVEPPLREPAPSFRDHKHLERVGVLSQMQPLGQRPVPVGRDVDRDLTPFLTARAAFFADKKLKRSAGDAFGSDSARATPNVDQASLDESTPAASAALDDQSPFPDSFAANGLAATQDLQQQPADSDMHMSSTSAYPSRDQPPIDPSLFYSSEPPSPTAVHNAQSAYPSHFSQPSQAPVYPISSPLDKLEAAIDPEFNALLAVTAEGPTNEYARRSLDKKVGRLKRDVLAPDSTPARSKASKSSKGFNNSITSPLQTSPQQQQQHQQQQRIILRNGPAAVEPSTAAASPQTADVAAPPPKKIKLNLGAASSASLSARAPVSPLKRALEPAETPTPSVPESHGDSSPLSSVNEAIVDQADASKGKKRKPGKGGRVSKAKAKAKAKAAAKAPPKRVYTVEENMELDRQEGVLDTEVARRKQHCRDLNVDVERGVSRESSWRSSVPTQDTPISSTGIPDFPKHPPGEQLDPGLGSEDESKPASGPGSKRDVPESASADTPSGAGRSSKRPRAAPKTKVSLVTPSGPKTLKLPASSRPTRGSERAQIRAEAEARVAAVSAEARASSATPVPSRAAGKPARGRRSAARVEQQRPSQEEGDDEEDEDDEDEVVSDHNDFCEVCRGDGFLVCCEHCDRSYHAACLVPPVEEDNLPDVFVCPDCSKKRPKRAMQSSFLFAPLVEQLAARAELPARDFELPAHLRDYFESNTTGLHGEYVETMPGPAPRKRARRGASSPPIDALATHDRQGKVIRCYHCGEGTDGKQRHLVSCDYCSFAWHTDCLNPPRANPPAKRPWMCPLHTSHDLRSLSVQPPLGQPTRRTRRPRQATIADTKMPRGHRNNGLIEVVDEASDSDSDDGFLSEENEGEIPRLPAKGIKLDFIAKVKADRDVHQATIFNEAAIRRAAWEEAQATLQRRQLESADAALRHAALQNESLARRSVAEGQAALSMLQFARDSPNARYHSDDLLNLVTTLQADAIADPRFAPKTPGAGSKRKRNSEEVTRELRQLQTLQAIINERQEALREEQDRVRAARSGTGPSRAGSSRAGPSRAGSSRAGPSRS